MTFFFFGKKFINIVSEPQETTLLFLKKFIDASLISGFLEKLLLFVDVILIFFLNILFFFYFVTMRLKVMKLCMPVISVAQVLNVKKCTKYGISFY